MLLAKRFHQNHQAVLAAVSINELRPLHNIMGIILRWKDFNFMLEIDILTNYSPPFLGVLSGDFLRGWVSKRHPDALLAKT